MTAETKIAEMLLKSGAITLRPQNPYKYASGILGPIYCDNRILLSKPDERNIIVKSFVNKMKSENINPDVIAGVATASISWAALVADRLKKPMIYIRKEAKDHGRENLIEGVLQQGQNVLVIEDLISTGGSSLSAVSAARNSGGVVNECLAIFTYNMEAARKGFEDSKCRLVTLTNFNVLIKVAANKGFIKKEEIELLQEWSRNPQEWGSRQL